MQVLVLILETKSIHCPAGTKPKHKTDIDVVTFEDRYIIYKYVKHNVAFRPKLTFLFDFSLRMLLTIESPFGSYIVDAGDGDTIDSIKKKVKVCVLIHMY